MRGGGCEFRRRPETDSSTAEVVARRDLGWSVLEHAEELLERDAVFGVGCAHHPVDGVRVVGEAKGREHPLQLGPVDCAGPVNVEEAEGGEDGGADGGRGSGHLRSRARLAGWPS